MFEQFRKTVTSVPDYQSDPFVKAVTDKLLSTLDQQGEDVTVEGLLEAFRNHLQTLLTPGAQASEEQAREILGSDFYSRADARAMLSFSGGEETSSEKPLLPYSVSTLYRAKGNYLLIEGVPVSVNDLCRTHPHLFNENSPPWFANEDFAKNPVASRAFLINTKIGAVIKAGATMSPLKNPHSHTQPFRVTPQSEVALAHVLSSLRNGTSAFGEDFRGRGMPDINGFPALAWVDDGKISFTYNEDP